MERILELKSVSKNFKSNDILNEIDFSLNSGEVFALLGHSGVGKSTIIKMITGEILPNKGNIFLFGKNISSLKSNDYKRIGVVTDNTALYEDFTAYYNLLIFARMFKIDKQKIEILLDTVGLSSDAKKKVKSFSKGMKQRLLIARAILHSPEIIFLDEPTDGLDINSIKTIHNIILELKKQDTAVFLITHNIDETIKVADKIGILHEKHIVGVDKSKIEIEKLLLV